MDIIEASGQPLRKIREHSKMTDEEKKKKREKTWIEEFLFNVMMECTRIAIDYFFDEFLGWREVDINEGVKDLDEIEEWEF